jgi:hypothetical protein
MKGVKKILDFPILGSNYPHFWSKIGKPQRAEDRRQKSEVNYLPQISLISRIFSHEKGQKAEKGRKNGQKSGEL